MIIIDHIKFSIEKLLDPDPEYYPGYFWLWNGPLSEDIIVKQLQDMKEHEARSVCVLPMPREFRPDSTNNQLNVSYLSPEFFEYIKIAVNESKRLGMNYWLYDEGGGHLAKHKVLGDTVEVVGIEVNMSNQGRGLVVNVRRKGKIYAIGLAELTGNPGSKNAGWIEMFHYWLERY